MAKQARLQASAGSSYLPSLLHGKNFVQVLEQKVYSDVCNKKEWNNFRR